MLKMRLIVILFNLVMIAIMFLYWLMVIISNYFNHEQPGKELFWIAITTLILSYVTIFLDKSHFRPIRYVELGGMIAGLLMIMVTLAIVR